VEHVGASPIVVAQTRRLHFAKRLLDDSDLSVTHISLASGFGSLRRFNDAFRKTYGKAPRELRNRNRSVRPLSEAAEVILRVAFRPPFDWHELRDFLASRAVPGVERIDEGGYARTVGSANGHVIVWVHPVAGKNELELRVRGAVAAELYQLSATTRRVFDLAADPAAVAAAFQACPTLGPLVRKRPGLRIPGAWDPFECAVRAVLGQQVSVAAARTLVARLVARVGRPVDSETEGLTHLFPSPEALVMADLSGLGITGARISALKGLAEAVAGRRLDFGAPTEEVTAALTTLPGFGEWTAQYIALRALGEPDAFPAADLVLRRVAAQGANMLSVRQLEERAEAWRPWRSYAVMHLWRAAPDK
jgi:AraC family transcriptional regulator of adaptative response / DNA-3-methyladenine glycosylase II